MAAKSAIGIPPINSRSSLVFLSTRNLSYNLLRQPRLTEINVVLSPTPSRRTADSCLVRHHHHPILNPFPANEKMGDVRFRHDQGMNRSEEGSVGGEQDDDSKMYRSAHIHDSVPTLYAVLAVVVLISFTGLVYLADRRLPTPVTFSDVGQYPDRFVAERAQAHLHRLISLGPKPTGSYENEVLAVDYLTKEIAFTMQHSRSSQKIVFDLQKPTGSFHLNFKPHGFTSYYAGVQNIVVRLIGQNLNSSSALLINCHFDTVPTSPGGSDDGLHCAVMLEVLRILSLSDVPLAHDVIFLFNGAEENILQAAHGFISQHKWARDVKAFINLEACGAGGREVLFQSVPNHPWLLKAYAKAAPYPHASVIAEEIFQGGLIPSDTDFRIFRDFGGIPGLDFAHARNGYVYHTKYDNEDQIPAGTLQHTGDNILALVRSVANSPLLGAPHNHDEGSLVFFDLFGFFVVYYSQLHGTIVNLLVALLSVYTVIGNVLSLGTGVRRSELARELGVAVMGPAFGWFLAFAWALLLALSLDWLNCTMSWYSGQLLVIPLYFCPAVVLGTLGIIIQLHLMKQSVLCGAVRVRFYSLGVQILWTSLLVAATIIGSRSAYIFAVLVFFPSLANTVMLWLFPPQSPMKGLLTIHLSSLIPPFLLVVYLAIQGFSVFIPIMGRVGSSVNSELVIALLSTLLCFLALSYMVPLILLLRHPLFVLGSLAILHFVTYCAVAFTPFTFPYSVSEPTSVFPQRVYLWHVDRTLYDSKGIVRLSDSGFWMINMDRNSPQSLKNIVTDLDLAQSGDDLCESELFCALPLYAPRVLTLVPHSLWIPGPKPFVSQHTTLDLTAQKMISIDTKRVTFTLSGPDHMGIMFSPKSDVNVEGWNLDAQLIPTSSFNNRPAYFIYYGHGLEGRPWNLTLDLKMKTEHTEGMLDFAVAGHYLHDEKHFTSSFVNLLAKFPPWTHVTPWVSTIKMWQF